jgi:hypothetical protein
MIYKVAQSTTEVWNENSTSALKYCKVIEYDKQMETENTRWEKNIVKKSVTDW